MMLRKRQNCRYGIALHFGYFCRHHHHHYLNSLLFAFNILSFQVTNVLMLAVDSSIKTKQKGRKACVKCSCQSVHPGMWFRHTLLLALQTKIVGGRDSLPSPSYGPSITSIPPRRLTPPNDLHHLPLPQPQILRHRIPHLDPRQLTLLQPISLQQLHFLFRTQQFMCWHQLMMRNIHQQILLLECFNYGRENDGDDLERGGRDGCLCD